MAAPCSSFVNCTALGKNLPVRSLVTLTEESPWEVDPGGIPGKLFLVFKGELQNVSHFHIKELLKC